MSSNGIYSPGDVTTVLCDIFPGAVTPLPDGVPAGVKIRVIVTTGSLTIAWLAGREGMQPIIGRVDVALTPEEAAGVNYTGGQAGKYTIGKGAGCSCGAAGLKNWLPFPNVTMVGSPRYEESVNRSQMTTRYSRP